MRNPDRINRILNKLARLWCVSQDQRLGQLILNLSGRQMDLTELFQTEDDKWEELLDKELLRLESGAKFADGSVRYLDRCWMLGRDQLYED